MATIGIFQPQPNGGFVGAIRTLTLELRRVELRPCEPTEGGPNFRVFAGETECGAAWAKTSRDDRHTSRSSWTIPASRLRSTRAWSTAILATA
jgi:uncharacterized protein (DUF736 family)